MSICSPAIILAHLQNVESWQIKSQIPTQGNSATFRILSKSLSILWTKNLKARCVYFKPEVTNSWSAWPLNIVRDDRSGYHSVLLPSCSHFSDNISDPPSRGPAWLQNIKSVSSLFRQLQYILILKRFPVDSFIKKCSFRRVSSITFVFSLQ